MLNIGEPKPILVNFEIQFIDLLNILKEKNKKLVLTTCFQIESVN